MDPPAYNSSQYQGAAPSEKNTGGPYYASNYNQASPLLSNQPVTTVIVTEKKSSCCGCSVAVAICFFICCCCIISASVIGGVFGYWGVQCAASRDFEEVKTFNASFSSDVGIQKINLETPGDINFVISSDFSSQVSIAVDAQIYASTEENANKVEFEYKNDPLDFGLEVENSWWHCPLVDVNVHLNVLEVASRNFSLDFKSFGGNVIVNSDPIFLLNLEQADIETFNGYIIARNLAASKDMKLQTLNGYIDASGITGESIEMDTGNGDITVENLAFEEIEIKSGNGKVEGSISLITPFPGSSCKMDIKTSNGEITLDTLLFPSFTDCDVEIHSNNGPVRVNIINFTGEYVLSSSKGDCFFNGENAGGYSTGSIVGPNQHQLKLKTGNGDIYLNTIF